MTSTGVSIKRGGPSVNAPGVYFKIGKFDSAFNQGTAFNRRHTVMYKGQNGVYLLLSKQLQVWEIWVRVQICRGTSSQYSRSPCGIQPVYHVLFINLWAASLT